MLLSFWQCEECFKSGRFFYLDYQQVFLAVNICLQCTNYRGLSPNQRVDGVIVLPLCTELFCMLLHCRCNSIQSFYHSLS